MLAILELLNPDKKTDAAQESDAETAANVSGSLGIVVDESQLSRTPTGSDSAADSVAPPGRDRDSADQPNSPTDPTIQDV